MAPAKGEFVDRINHKHVVAAEIDRAPGDPFVDGVVVVVVVVGVRKRVVCQELQAPGESLIHLSLKRVVSAGSVVAIVVVQRERELCAVACSVFWSAKYPTLTLCVCYACYGVDLLEIHDGYLVDVVVWSIPGKSMCTLAADIRDFRGNGVRNLTLHRDVPRIHRGKDLLRGTNVCAGN